MSYKCEILADSLSPQGHRLITFKVTYPRIIHAEMCRHRILSRNTASSRAIPFDKMVKDVQENPFIPIAWQKDHKGMQGTEYFTERLSVDNTDLFDLKTVWLDARDAALVTASRLNRMGSTKQLCNRLLEPFVWTTELVSGTEWGNFFELRCPKYKSLDGNQSKGYVYDKSWKDYCKRHGYDSSVEGNIIDRLNINGSQAEIHIQKIAEMMWDAYNESKPKTLQPGEWHIPYGDNFDSEELINLYYLPENFHKPKMDSYETLKLKIATARAARISYTTLGDNPKIDYEADIKLHDRLLESKHLSCFEHCSRAMSEEEYESFYKGEGANKGHTGLDENKGWCNNYRSFIQYRYLIENQ